MQGSHIYLKERPKFSAPGAISQAFSEKNLRLVRGWEPFEKTIFSFKLLRLFLHRLCRGPAVN